MGRRPKLKVYGPYLESVYRINAPLAYQRY